MLCASAAANNGCRIRKSCSQRKNATEEVLIKPVDVLWKFTPQDRKDVILNGLVNKALKL
ncbi:hypothetical protein COL922a_012317 [Colletotrichum nupharicola]|nr:hypothetical protein COL922a_012317 [Colletotrichum nupharicola]